MDHLKKAIKLLAADRQEMIDYLTSSGKDWVQNSLWTIPGVTALNNRLSDEFEAIAGDDYFSAGDPNWTEPEREENMQQIVINEGSDELIKGMYDVIKSYGEPEPSGPPSPKEFTPEELESGWYDAENEAVWTEDELGEKVGNAYRPESGVLVVTFPDGTAMSIRYD